MMTIWMKPQRVFSAKDAAEFVGGDENFQRLVKAGWLKPLAGKQRGMDYDLRALDAVIDRVVLEGWPPEPKKRHQVQELAS